MTRKTRSTNARPATAIFCCAALVSIFLTPPAQAEIYRIIDEDGNVSFTDKPPPSRADEAEPVDIDPNAQNSSMSSDAIEQNQPDWLKEALEKREAEAAARQKAQPGASEMKEWRASLKSAKQRLREAESRQKQGLIATEGDFIGKAGGGVRPSQQYFEKLRKLDQDVVDAKDHLEAVRRAKP